MLAPTFAEAFTGTCPVTVAGANAICPDGSAPQLIDLGDGNIILGCRDEQCNTAPVATKSTSSTNCCNSGDNIVSISGNTMHCSIYASGAVYTCQLSSTSSVASAVTTSATTSIATIVETTSTAPETQAGLSKAAGDVNLTAANHEANAGLLYCAEGANNELETSGTGANEVASCQRKFAAADQLAQMNGKLGHGATLSRDEGMLNDEAALAALEKFEKNFGISKEDYVSRMLASHGKSTEFADMLGSKLTDAQLEKMFAGAEEAQPTNTELAAKENSSDVSAAAKVAKKDTSMRDSLRAKLEAADAKRKLASAPSKTDYSSIKNPNEKLQPHGLENWINGAEDSQEESLTIFDVVHQKLQSLRQRERI